MSVVCGRRIRARNIVRPGQQIVDTGLTVQHRNLRQTAAAVKAEIFHVRLQSLMPAHTDGFRHVGERVSPPGGLFFRDGLRVKDPHVAGL